MKFIFDFDDVLFFNTKQLKERIYASLAKAGVSRSKAEEYYKKTDGINFQLKDMLNYFSLNEDLYEEILKENKNFINKELLEIIKKLGKENCFILTHGVEDWQKDKIKSAGIAPLFSDIIIVSEQKKDSIENICVKYKDEQVIFVDDKIKYLENIDMTKCPNLKTILYDENGLEKLKAEIQLVNLPG